MDGAGTQDVEVKRSRRAARAAAAVLVTLALPASAQIIDREYSLVGANVQKRASAVLALMGYSLTPDVTTGSLAISDTSSGDPGFRLTTLGGGFTWSRAFPLYLEGTAAYSRYDPTFIASDGQQTRPIPVSWNSLAGTGGIGWDFFLTDELRIRPILNFSLGHVESDAALLSRIVENRIDREIDFVRNGSLNAVGLGGSLMLDYERYRPDYEIDLELRYTNIHLRTTSNASAVEGSATTQSASLWSRWRAPTGLTLLDRPFRYVLEFSHSRYFGDEAATLGVEYLTALGAGFELDSSKYPIFITRTRFLVRYRFSPHVHGTSVGLAVSF